MGQYYNTLIERNGEATAYNRRVSGEYTPAKLTEHAWWENPFVTTITNLLWKDPAKVAWVGDYSNCEEKAIKENLYERAWSDDAQGIEKREMYLDGKYLVDHTQKLVLDCDAYKSASTDADGWCLHPLPLLTAIGNGEGCGDYFGINKEDVGSWCWDEISVEDEPPEGYKPVMYTFVDA